MLLLRIHLTMLTLDQMWSHPSMPPVHSSTIDVLVPSNAEARQAPKGLNIQRVVGQPPILACFIYVGGAGLGS